MTDINSSLVAINSSLQLYDPCWLPSAIMQTTAALLGLYAVVYVLMIERVGGSEMQISETTVPLTLTGLDVFFITILSMSIFTIFLNVLWLANLSVDGFQLGFSDIETLAIGTFGLTLAGIFLYTLAMITFLRELRAFEREKRIKHIETDAGGDLLKDPKGEIKD